MGTPIKKSLLQKQKQAEIDHLERLRKQRDAAATGGAAGKDRKVPAGQPPVQQAQRAAPARLQRSRERAPPTGQQAAAAKKREAAAVATTTAAVGAPTETAVKPVESAAPAASGDSALPTASTMRKEDVGGSGEAAGAAAGSQQTTGVTAKRLVSERAPAWVTEVERAALGCISQLQPHLEGVLDARGRCLLRQPPLAVEVAAAAVLCASALADASSGDAAAVRNAAERIEDLPPEDPLPPEAWLEVTRLAQSPVDLVSVLRSLRPAAASDSALENVRSTVHNFIVTASKHWRVQAEADAQAALARQLLSWVDVSVKDLRCKTDLATAFQDAAEPTGELSAPVPPSAAAAVFAAQAPAAASVAAISSAGMPAAPAFSIQEHVPFHLEEDVSFSAEHRWMVEEANGENSADVEAAQRAATVAMLVAQLQSPGGLAAESPVGVVESPDEESALGASASVPEEGPLEEEQVRGTLFEPFSGQQAAPAVENSWMNCEQADAAAPRRDAETPTFQEEAAAAPAAAPPQDAGVAALMADIHDAAAADLVAEADEAAARRQRKEREEEAEAAAAIRAAEEEDAAAAARRQRAEEEEAADAAAEAARKAAEEEAERKSKVEAEAAAAAAARQRAEAEAAGAARRQAEREAADRERLAAAAEAAKKRHEEEAAAAAQRAAEEAAARQKAEEDAAKLRAEAEAAARRRAEDEASAARRAREADIAEKRRIEEEAARRKQAEANAAAAQRARLLQEQAAVREQSMASTAAAGPEGPSVARTPAAPGYAAGMPARQQPAPAEADTQGEATTLFMETLARQCEAPPAAAAVFQPFVDSSRPADEAATVKPVKTETKAASAALGGACAVQAAASKQQQQPRGGDEELQGLQGYLQDLEAETKEARTSKRNRSAWSTECTHNVGEDVSTLRGQVTLLTSFDRVSSAVEALRSGDKNIPHVVFEEGFCMVFHKGQQTHFLIYRKDKREVVEERFNFRTGRLGPWARHVLKEAQSEAKEGAANQPEEPKKEQAWFEAAGNGSTAAALEAAWATAGKSSAAAGDKSSPRAQQQLPSWSAIEDMLTAAPAKQSAIPSSILSAAAPLRARAVTSQLSFPSAAFTSSAAAAPSSASAERPRAFTEAVSRSTAPVSAVKAPLAPAPPPQMPHTASAAAGSRPKSKCWRCEDTGTSFSGRWCVCEFGEAARSQVQEAKSRAAASEAVPPAGEAGSLADLICDAETAATAASPRAAAGAHYAASQAHEVRSRCVRRVRQLMTAVTVGRTRTEETAELAKDEGGGGRRLLQLVALATVGLPLLFFAAVELGYRLGPEPERFV
eukprot:TRINITY_DN17662_c0_g3_i1.p1 TRINITY_DN17662_c0_g3~~TRINITY_DN17662_c0_g3_i1.p1  ORF type:complete len:1317 (-),score=484.15 TRINITY_DN17662_c0_g3_i1:138-4088(-)